MALIVALAVSLGAIAALDRDGRPAGDDVDGGTTSTVNGVTITYPSAWTLLELTGSVNVGEGRVGPTGTVTGHAVLQLSNVDLELNGCPGGIGFAPLPDDTAILYVQQLDWPREPGAELPQWPVEPGGPVEAPQPTTCEGSMPRYATWQVGGATFEAFLLGDGATYERLLRAFRSMRFTGTSAGAPTLADGSTAAGPIHVLASGTANGQPWNLVTFASRFPLVPSRICIDVQVAGRFLGPLCDLDTVAEMQLGGPSLGVEGTSMVVNAFAHGASDSAVTYVWGVVEPAVPQVRIEISRGRGAILTSERRALPESFEVDLEAYVGVVGGNVNGTLYSLDGEEQLGAIPISLDPSRRIRLQAFPLDAIPIAIGSDQSASWSLVAWHEPNGRTCVGETVGQANGGSACLEPSGWRVPDALMIDSTYQVAPGHTVAFGRIGDDVATVEVARESGRSSSITYHPAPPGFEELGDLIVIHYRGRDAATVQALDADGRTVATASAPP
jgi:hypothetical protein